MENLQQHAVSRDFVEVRDEAEKKSFCVSIGKRFPAVFGRGKSASSHLGALGPLIDLMRLQKPKYRVRTDSSTTNMSGTQTPRVPLLLTFRVRACSNKNI